MKIRKLPPPTLPPPEVGKTLHKVRHFIRSYPDRQHPESYEDTEIKTRTSTAVMRANLMSDAYQYFDVIEVTFSDESIEPYTTAPRNFSPLFLNDVDKAAPLPKTNE
jgi:hypothetical protein